MKILVADHDPLSRRRLEETLRSWELEVISAGNGEEALRTLQSKEAPRMAILDGAMPSPGGFEICRRFRTSPGLAYVYIIFLTTDEQRQSLDEGFDVGADDFLPRSFDLPELKSRLRSGQRILDLHDQLAAAQESLREQATRDALTGLWNRAAVLGFLDQALDRSARERQPVGILLVDLDGLKSINERHGHVSGDIVLRETARRLRSAVRAYDSIGRLGDGEFLVVLPGCGERSAAGLGERLRIGICTEPFVTPAEGVAVTVSVGAASAAEGRRVDSDRLTAAAETALRRAKSAGRNRVEVAIEGDYK